MDVVALDTWTARVVMKSHETELEADFKSGTVDLAFMQKLAQLSWSDNGPILAKEYLSKHGIPLVVEPHLPKTHLDGAAILVDSGRPVIGLSVRYDRIDNFWFCLMHELAHVALHLDSGVQGFYDDLESSDLGNIRELEADKLALEALIPSEVWNSSSAKDFPAPPAAKQLAEQLGIHPAIVAGRIRRRANNYKILNQLVGHREVRKHFSGIKWNK